MVYDLPTRLAGFAADMRAAGIHVGVGVAGGRGVRCVNCGEDWPCAVERAEEAHAVACCQDADCEEAP